MKYKALQNYFNYSDGSSIAIGEFIEIYNIYFNLDLKTFWADTDKGKIPTEFLTRFCKKESLCYKVKTFIVNKFKKYAQKITKK